MTRTVLRETRVTVAADAGMTQVDERRKMAFGEAKATEGEAYGQMTAPFESMRDTGARAMRSVKQIAAQNRWKWRAKQTNTPVELTQQYKASVKKDDATRARSSRAARPFRSERPSSGSKDREQRA